MAAQGGRPPPMRQSGVSKRARFGRGLFRSRGAALGPFPIYPFFDQEPAARPPLARTVQVFLLETLVLGAALHALPNEDLPPHAPPHRAYIEEDDGPLDAAVVTPTLKSFLDGENPRSRPVRGQTPAFDDPGNGGRVLSSFVDQGAPQALQRPRAAADTTQVFGPIQRSLATFVDSEAAQRSRIFKSGIGADDPGSGGRLLSPFFDGEPAIQKKRIPSFAETTQVFGPIQHPVATFLDADSPPHARAFKAALGFDDPGAGRLLSTFVDTTEPVRARTTRSRPEDPFVFAPVKAPLASFIDVDLTARATQARTKAGLDELSASKLASSFVDTTEPTHRIVRPVRVEDALPLTLLEESDVSSFLDNEHPTAPKRAPLFAETTQVFGPIQHPVATFLETDPAVRARQFKGAQGLDDPGSGKILSSFIDIGDPATQRKRFVSFSETTQVFETIQHPVATFLDTEQPPKSRAFKPGIGFDDLGSPHSLSTFVDPGDPARSRVWRTIAEELPTLDTFKAPLASFVDSELPTRANTSRAKAGLDDLGSPRLVSPFVDVNEPVHRIARPARADDALPLTLLEESDVASFLDNEHPAAPRRAFRLPDDAFVPNRVLANFLEQDPIVTGLSIRAKVGEDVTPLTRVLAPFLNDELVKARPPLRARAEDAGPLTLFEEADLASFLELEHPASRRFTPQTGGDAFVPNRVLANFLEEEPAVRSPWRRARSEDSGPLTLLEEANLASFLESEHPTGRRYTPANGGDALVPLRVLAIFLDNEPARPGRASRARTEEAFIPLRVLAPFLNDEAVKAKPPLRPRAEDAAALTLFEEADLASFLDGEHPVSRRFAAQTGGDTFVPGGRLLSSFVDTQNPIAPRAIRARAEDVLPSTPLEENDLASFFEDERPRVLRPGFHGLDEPFIPNRVLAPFLGDEDPRRSRSLSKRLDDAPPLTELEESNLANLLENEHQTVQRLRPPQGIVDEPALPKVLAPWFHPDEPQPRPWTAPAWLLPVLRDADFVSVDPDIADFLEWDSRTSQAPTIRRWTEEVFVPLPVLFPILVEETFLVRPPKPLQPFDAEPLALLQLAELADFVENEHPRAPTHTAASVEDAFVGPVPTPPPPPPPKPPKRPIVPTRPSGGGGGGGFVPRPQRDISVFFPEPEEEDADYALMVVTEGATIRALASGQVTHIEDARGKPALKLEADDGTNYYYADLSGYVGTDRRVERGEAIAKSAREAVPEITSKRLPESTVSKPKLRTVAPVFVEPPPPPKRRYVRLIPIEPVLSAPPPPPNEWAGIVPPAVTPESPMLKGVVMTGALAALLFALNAFEPRKIKRKRSVPTRRKR